MSKKKQPKTDKCPQCDGALVPAVMHDENKGNWIEYLKCEACSYVPTETVAVIYETLTETNDE